MNCVAYTAPRVLVGKRLVFGRVPILRRNDKLVLRHQSVCNRNDFISGRHRQRAARQKIVLDIDEKEGIHRQDSFSSGWLITCEANDSSEFAICISGRCNRKWASTSKRRA